MVSGKQGKGFMWTVLDDERAKARGLATRSTPFFPSTRTSDTTLASAAGMTGNRFHPYMASHTPPSTEQQLAGWVITAKSGAASAPSLFDHDLFTGLAVPNTPFMASLEEQSRADTSLDNGSKCALED